MIWPRLCSRHVIPYCAFPNLLIESPELPARAIVHPSFDRGTSVHRLIAGTCEMDLKLTTQGPWMVRGKNDGNITHLLQGIRGPVLPASSLKGVLRSCAERILRTMHPQRSR